MKTSRCIIILATIFSVWSCDPNDPKNDLAENLIGTWLMDSLTVPAGFVTNAQSYERVLKIEIKPQNEFSLSWMNSDVGNSYHGVYMLAENKNRDCFTICLIPDYQKSDSTIIRNYFNYDILAFSTDRLVLAQETQFLPRSAEDGTPYTITYNRNNYLSKIEQEKSPNR